MHKKLIIHCIPDSPISNQFIDFTIKNLPGEHIFINVFPSSKYLENESIIHLNLKSISGQIRLFKRLSTSYKIILHTLPIGTLLKLFFFFPWLLKKCYWVIWGGDLYAYQHKSNKVKSRIKELIRKIVIRNLGGLITYIEGDYLFARQWYGAKGAYCECIMYPSNVYKEYDIKLKEHSTINIQVGNSSDPSNNHLEVFEKLERYKDKDIKIIVPLSYGNKTYAKEVIEQGRKIYGDKLVPLTEFMPFDQYLEFLSEIDIAIFNHNRQQAMGNIITLLGVGKKVYMRNDITPWKMFEDIEIKVFNIANVKIELLNADVKKQNQTRVKEHFSEKNLIFQWNNLLGITNG